MTETVLLTMTLVMMLAVVLQVFLIDEHIFRLATTAHQRLFTLRAFPDNRPDVEYDTVRERWDGPDQWVPVIGFFQPYGLTRDDLRIRSVRRPAAPKDIMIGRGTAPSITAGLAADLDPSAWLSEASDALGELTRARELGEELKRTRGDRR